MNSVNNKVENWQLKKIFAIAKELKKTKEDIYVIAGVTSLKEMGRDGANSLIGKLEDLQGTYTAPSNKSSKIKRPAVAGMITAGQQAKVWAIMYELEKKDRVKSSATLGARLCGIINRQFKVNAVAEKPFIWITYTQGNLLIEILKKYVENAKGGE